MGVNISENKVHCFKCLEKHSPISVLMEVERMESYTEARKFLSIQEEYDLFENYTHSKIEYTPIELPDGYRLITQGDSIFGKAARAYLTKRGFNIKQLSLKGVGYCSRGEYAGYIIFPFYRQGKLVYFQGRIYMGDGPKMKNPPEEQYGVGKTQLIYNQDALYMYDKIYWVESITNAETLGDLAAAGLGKTVSNYQMSNLLYSPCSRLIILLDPDAWELAVKMAMQIVHYKRVKLVRLPEGKDVNDIGKKATLKLVEKTDYVDYMKLLKLKNALNEGPINSHSRIPTCKVDRRGS